MDYSTARSRLFEEARDAFGCAPGGSWVGFEGLDSLLLSLAAAGNCAARTDSLSKENYESILVRLRECYLLAQPRDADSAETDHPDSELDKELMLFF